MDPVAAADPDQASPIGHDDAGAGGDDFESWIGYESAQPWLMAGAAGAAEARAE